MKLRCEQCEEFDFNLTIGKIYELDETRPLHNLSIGYDINGNRSFWIKNDLGLYSYYNSYLFTEITPEVISNERNDKLNSIGI